MAENDEAVYFVLGDLDAQPLPGPPTSDMAKRTLLEAFVIEMKEFGRAS